MQVCISKTVVISCLIASAAIYMLFYPDSFTSLEISEKSITSDYKELKNIQSETSLKKSDLIYDHSRNTVPLVIEEYNLIFFLTAKVASTEFLRFFMRLENNPLWCSSERIHEFSNNGMTYLSDYTLPEAESMMKDPKWTKAKFVRHPKPRLLSAFLDKFVQHKNHFQNKTCPAFAKYPNKTLEECIDATNRDDFSFFLHEITQTLNENVHWSCIMSSVDEKWWPYVDKIFVMEDDFSLVTQKFLESIKSNIDGVSAWEKIGKSGWGEDESSCERLGSSSFMEQKSSKHHTNANDHMREYYTPELEKFVDTHFKADLSSKYFTFKPVHLFTNENDQK